MFNRMYARVQSRSPALFGSLIVCTSLTGSLYWKSNEQSGNETYRRGKKEQHNYWNVRHQPQEMCPDRRGILHYKQDKHNTEHPKKNNFQFFHGNYP